MDPIEVLLEVRDPRARGKAHLTLGRTAWRDGKTDAARRHFREAARLSPEDPEVVRALRTVGETVERRPEPRRRRIWPFGRRDRRS